MKFKTIKELRGKLLLKYTILYDGITVNKSNDIREHNILKSIFLDVCIARENLNQLHSWLSNFNNLYNSFKLREPNPFSLELISEEDILEEILYIHDNYYVTKELENYLDKIIEETNFMDNAFNSFFGNPKLHKIQSNEIIELTKEEAEISSLKKEGNLINLKYSVSEWEEYFKLEFKKMLDSKKINNKVLKQFFN
jgi:hypothetical protein